MKTNLSPRTKEKLYTIAFLLIPLVYVAVLSFSVSNECFWADDFTSLRFVRGLSSVWSLFGHDSFNYFRPVKNIVWFGFSKLAPFGLEWCHVVSICIGALSFFPVQALFRRVLGSKGKALAAAAVWLLSPTLVSCSAWLSCTNIQIAISFASLAIVCHDSIWRHGSISLLRVILACLFLFLSLLSYECMIATTPILLAFDCLLRSERLKSSRGKSVHLAYWVITLVYLYLRHLSCARDSSALWVDAERWQLVVSSPYFTIRHFSIWFWPFGQFTVLGNYRWGDIPLWELAGCAVLGIVVLVLAFLIRRKNPILSFGILFATLGFAPVSNCLGFGNGPYGDYYLALSSIGISISCIEIADKLLSIHGRLRCLGAFLVILFGLTRTAGMVESARWARLWGRGDLAFEESVRNHPVFFANKLAFVQFLTNEGRYEEARELGDQIETAIGGHPERMSTIHLVRALYALNVSHNTQEALTNLDRCQAVLGFNITSNLCHFYRGCVFDDLIGDMETAENEYRSALGDAWGGELVPCADRLARLKAIQGDLNEALRLWKRASEIDPENVSVLWNLSVAYREIGDVENADKAWKKVQKLVGH